jgi:hypothetical protein
MLALLFLLCSTVATPAFAVTINFDDGNAGSIVGSYYSGLGVTFNNASWTTNFGSPGSSGSLGVNASNSGFFFLKPNAIVANITSGASSVSITGIDVGFNGLRIDAYDALVGGNLVDYQQVFGTILGGGEFYTLTDSATLIMRVEMYQVQYVENDGVFLEDFSFTPVPEPATIFLLCAGLAGLGLVGRRAKK